MRTLMILFVLAAIALMAVSCTSPALLGAGLTSHKNTYGKSIDPARVLDIQKGQTTSAEVVSWFGAPSSITEAGPNDLYSWKQCQNGGTSVGGVGAGVTGSLLGIGALGKSSTKEKYNELTVVVNRATDKVVEYNYRKEFGK